ncbi:MAG TPA: hypothetical protein VL500_05365 [Candidatus Eisenbacteria bacterium]|nr:hypothetical protein [Candidatus Eisenbacteria bacterium]
MEHFHDRFERVFSARTFIELNAAIIVAAETMGGGKMFFDTGLIHVPVILFGILLFARISLRIRLFDPQIRSFLHSCLASLVILLAANVLEFAVQNLDIGGPLITLYGAVIALRVVSMLVLAYGTLVMLMAYGIVSEGVAWALVAALAAIAIVTVVVTDEPLRASMTSPLTFVMLSFSVGLGQMAALLKLASRAPVFANAMGLMLAATLFVSLGAAAGSVHLMNIDYPPITVQATYFTQFCDFFAISLLFLGIGAFVDLGQTYHNQAWRKAQRMKAA